VVALLGCAATVPLPEAGPVARADDLVQLLTARDLQLKDLRSRVHLVLRIDGVRHKASAVLRYRAPDTLKLDVTGTLGIGLMHALSLGDSMALYLPRDNQLLSGEPNAVLRRVTGVDLGYYSVKHAILGLAYLPPLQLPRVVRYEALGDTIHVETLEPLWQRRMWFDRHSAVLLREEVRAAHGALLSSREMAGYREIGGALLPRRTKVSQGGDHIEIVASECRVNRPQLGELAQLRVPADAIRLH